MNNMAGISARSGGLPGMGTLKAGDNAKGMPADGAFASLFQMVDRGKGAANGTGAATGTGDTAAAGNPKTTIGRILLDPVADHMPGEIGIASVATGAKPVIGPEGATSGNSAVLADPAIADGDTELDAGTADEEATAGAETGTETDTDTDTGTDTGTGTGDALAQQQAQVAAVSPQAPTAVQTAIAAEPAAIAAAQVASADQAATKAVAADASVKPVAAVAQATRTAQAEAQAQAQAQATAKQGATNAAGSPLETPVAEQAAAQAQPREAQGDKSLQSREATAFAAAQAGAAGTGDTEAGDAGTPGEGRNSKRHSLLAAQLARAAGKGTQSADASSTSQGVSALRDIMSSLPPGIQSQLDPALAGAAGAGTQSLAVPLAAATATTGAQLNDTVIDMGVEGQWIDRMAKEIAGLTEGTGHSRFQLNPPNLGRIQIDLWQGDNATHLRMVTETDEAARRLRDGQGALETNARMAALSLGSVTVEKAHAPFDSGRDQQQGQNARQNGEFSGEAQDQANGQTQDQTGPGRGSVNQDGLAAVMGNDRQADSAPANASDRKADPRVRFA